MWSGLFPMNPVLRVTFFWLLLIVSCGYAAWRGRKYERMAALVFVTATILSVISHSPLRGRYVGIETSDLIVDTAVLFATLAIALGSDRFWPLWTAGLQLVDTMSHLMKAIDANLIPQVYGAAERVWSYPILFVLLIGAWRQHRREQRGAAALGADASQVGMSRVGGRNSGAPKSS
jgi:hypothetical protein